MACIFPSKPLEPNPPGTRTPWHDLSASHAFACFAGFCTSPVQRGKPYSLPQNRPDCPSHCQCTEDTRRCDAFLLQAQHSSSRLPAHPATAFPTWQSAVVGACNVQLAGMKVAALCAVETGIASYTTGSHYKTATLHLHITAVLHRTMASCLGATHRALINSTSFPYKTRQAFADDLRQEEDHLVLLRGVQG